MASAVATKEYDSLPAVADKVSYLLVVCLLHVYPYPMFFMSRRFRFYVEINLQYLTNHYTQYSLIIMSSFYDGSSRRRSYRDERSRGEISSNKRHHHVNAARQAKMDALLQELQTAKPSELPHRGGRDDSYYGSIHDGENDFHGYGDRFAPQKKGSYVEPGMEHLTTNLFVGNLDPMTTEEELTDCFRQFGQYYVHIKLLSDLLNAWSTFEGQC